VSNQLGGSKELVTVHRALLCFSPMLSHPEFLATDSYVIDAQVEGTGYSPNEMGLIRGSGFAPGLYLWIGRVYQRISGLAEDNKPESVRIVLARDERPHGDSDFWRLEFEGNLQKALGDTTNELFRMKPTEKPIPYRLAAVK